MISAINDINAGKIVADAIDEGGGVNSIFGRTGTVVAASGDYTVDQVTGAASLASPPFTGTPTGSASGMTVQAAGSTTARSLAARAAEVFNVQDYGAKGDGVTDDTVAIQAAMDACAGTGGTVLFPRSSSFYRTTAQLWLTSSCRGDSYPEIRVDQGTGTGTRAILIVNGYTGSGLVIQGLHLNGQWDGTARSEFDHGIALGNSSNITIRDCLIENTQGDNITVCFIFGGNLARDGIVHAGIPENVLIDNCRLLNPYRCGVAIVSGHHVTVARCVLSIVSTYVSAIDIEPDPNWYALTPSGTVTATQGSTAVTATGGPFTGAVIGGAYLRFSNDMVRSYRVATVTNANALTLTSSFLGATSSTLSASVWGGDYGSVSDVVIQDNTYTGSSPFVTIPGVNPGNLTANIRIAGNLIHCPCVSIFAGGPLFINGLQITSNRFTGTIVNTGDYSSRNSSLWIVNVQGHVDISNNIDTSDGYYGWHFEGLTTGGKFTNNLIMPGTNNRVYGIVFAYQCANCLVAGNLVTTATYYQALLFNSVSTLYTTYSGGSPSGHLIVGNVITASTSGIYFDGPAATNVTITSNRITAGSSQIAELERSHHGHGLAG